MSTSKNTRRGAAQNRRKRVQKPIRSLVQKSDLPNAPQGKLIGYARVSTSDQELRVQIDALEQMKCHNIWKEHISASKRKRRPQLELALIDLRPGDTLVVHKLDRFARNLRELFELLDRVHASGAMFMSITERFDLTTAIGRAFMGMMGVFAQFEAELISERTSAGIKTIQARGIPYGREKVLSPKRAAKLVAERKAGTTIAALALKYRVSTATVNNYVKRARLKRRGRT